jgi:hypothetical protein
MDKELAHQLGTVRFMGIVNMLFLLFLFLKAYNPTYEMEFAGSLILVGALGFLVVYYLFGGILLRRNVEAEQNAV